MWHVWRVREVHTEFWWGHLKEGDHLEDLDMHGKMIQKRILKESGGGRGLD